METPILFPVNPDDFFLRIKKVVEAAISENNPASISPPPKGLTSKPLLSIKEVCDFFQITKPTVYDWIDHEKLKPYKVRGRVYFLMSDINNLINNSSDNVNK